jgi:hypothetical protein
VTKVRRGGYVFLRWSGDHPPRHVHVLRNGRLIVKWNLDAGVAMRGNAGRRLVELIHRLEREGRL